MHPDVIGANRQQDLSQPSSEIQFLLVASLYQEFSYWDFPGGAVVK